MQSPSIGILLVQLGTPDSPDTTAVKRFLAEFLADRRVVDLSRWFWLPLLHGVILPSRSPRSAALYQKIWRDDGLSPLMHHSKAVAAGVAATLGDTIRVALAMRYGSPGIDATLHNMVKAGIQRILILPLFPQYSCATTATVTDAVCDAFRHHRLLPALRFAPDFHHDPGYIHALADSVRQRLDPTQPRHWIFSFHGLPQRYVDQGDPYAQQCTHTAQLLAKELHLPDQSWQLGFQSRFGREPWLLPDTAELLVRLPGEGHKEVAVICPGFVADCLETLEEIAVQGREGFLQAGGERFFYVPCLNDSPAWINALSALIRRELSGWWPIV